MPSGETAIREIFDDDCVGSVVVWDLTRSVMETRLPTGEISNVLLAITVLPPL